MMGDAEGISSNAMVFDLNYDFLPLMNHDVISTQITLGSNFPHRLNIETSWDIHLSASSYM